MGKWMWIPVDRWDVDGRCTESRDENQLFSADDDFPINIHHSLRVYNNSFSALPLLSSLLISLPRSLMSFSGQPIVDRILPLRKSFLG